MDDAGTEVAEGEAVDAVSEVVVHVGHEGGDVDVSLRQRQRLAGRDVEVTGHLVQYQRAVDPARVRRRGGLCLSEMRRGS